MKKKAAKKAIIIEVALVVVLGIAVVVLLLSNRHLGKLNSDSITIDITQPINVEDYLKDVKEGTEVTYDFDEANSKLTIYLTKGDKTETLEPEVTIVYPRVDIPDDITIDTYTGYDINKLVSAEDGVTLTSSLDEANGQLTITYTKGDYTNTVVKNVTVTSSDPRDNTRYYDCTNIRGTKYEMVLYPDGTLAEYETRTGNVYTGEYEMTDNNNGKQFNMINAPRSWSFGIYVSDDNEDASFFIGNDLSSGSSSRDACVLTEVKMGNQYDADQAGW